MLRAMGVVTWELQSFALTQVQFGTQVLSFILKCCFTSNKLDYHQRFLGGDYGDGGRARGKTNALPLTREALADFCIVRLPLSLRIGGDRRRILHHMCASCRTGRTSRFGFVVFHPARQGPESAQPKDRDRVPIARGSSSPPGQPALREKIVDALTSDAELRRGGQASRRSLTGDGLRSATFLR